MTGDLFSAAVQGSGPHTAASAPETSREAAEKVKPAQGSIRSQVMAYAERRGRLGFTDEELVEDLSHIPVDSLRPRRCELEDENWILDSGNRNRNSSGNSVVVWVHRKFVEGAPPVQERKTAVKANHDKAQGRTWAEKLANYAETARKEGRSFLASELKEASEVMARLSR